MAIRYPSLSALIALLIFLAASTGAAQEGPARTTPSLAGRCLVASENLADPRFARTVVYMVRHDADGALGLIVNRAIGSGPLASFLKGFGIDPGVATGDIRLHYGGPVAPENGFVLHSPDYSGPGTIRVDALAAFSADAAVLEALARGQGPKRWLFAFGYAGWGPGQLEGEIAREDWLTAPADEDLIFGADVDAAWERARARAGMTL